MIAVIAEYIFYLLLIAAGVVIWYKVPEIFEAIRDCFTGIFNFILKFIKKGENNMQAIAADKAIIDYEAFEEAIYSCCDTLVRNRAGLYMLAKDKSTGFSIRFNFNPGEVVTMDIAANQLVHKTEFEEGVECQQ